MIILESEWDEAAGVAQRSAEEGVEQSAEVVPPRSVILAALHLIIGLILHWIITAVISIWLLSKLF